MVALSKQGPCADDTAELNIKLAQLQQENSELQSMNAQLHEAIEDLQRKTESNQVITYKDGRYTDKLRECIIKLLALNVGINDVNTIINTVMTLA